MDVPARRRAAAETVADRFPRVTTRRRLLARGAAVAACAAAAAAVEGCGALRAIPLAAAPRTSSAPVALTVWYPVSYHDTPPFPNLLREALRAAVQQSGGSYTLSFSTGLPQGEAGRWFPSPNFNPSGQSPAVPASSSSNPSPLTNPPPVQLVDDPSMTMPDLVIAPHHDIDGYLAARALDLSPYVREFASTLRAVPSSLLSQGQAYAPGGAGQVQAALPLLRVPLVCAVPKATSVVSGGQAWTADAFTALLQAAASRFVAPNGPLAYVPLAGASPPFGPAPVPGGLLTAAAVGHGTQFAATTTAASLPRFTTPQAQAALQQVVGWVAYSAIYAACASNQVPARGFTVFMGPLGEALGLAPPVPRFRGGRGFDRFQQPVMPLPGTGAGIAWKLAPLPAFPLRPAVPTDNLDVMVWKDTAHPAEASRLAAALLSVPAQTALIGWERGLSVQARLALGQLAQSTGSAEAAAIASTDHDVALPDAFGPQTDANAAAYDLLRQNLAQALQSVAGTSGGFVASDTCTAPASGLDAPTGPWLLAVTEAQVASLGGSSFASSYGGG